MKTKDIYFVALILCNEGIISKINRDISKIVEFEIEMDEEKFDSLQLSWIQGNVMVNAVRYKEALQKVKSLIYAKN